MFTENVSMNSRHLTVREKRWPMREAFVIARGAQTDQQSIIVEVTDDYGRRGRGEGCGVMYAGETPEIMIRQVESVRGELERGADQYALLDLLPPGGARCAIDAALWDLQAKSTGQSVYNLLGVSRPQPVVTAFTIGIRDLPGYETAARRVSSWPLLKVKVDNSDPIAALTAVRCGAPDARLIVDPNQSWSVDDMLAMMPQLVELGVVLLEQPISVGAESDLDNVACQIPLCADELINTEDDLKKALGRFQVINIKLDKTGGLTEAWRLADAAVKNGFDLMVGCMAGSSLSMAPAHVLAQRCVYVDLDGPLLQADDWPDGLEYSDGVVSPARQAFWG